MTSPSASSHRVPSTDGVTLALHDLGGDGPTVLFCHPTGFHGMVWAPVARHLSPTMHCWALDFRGHGDSSVPQSGDLGWDGMAQDVLTATAHIAPDQRPLLGVGHSMGGAALFLAEQARPGTFGALWCYEPIVFPPLEGRPQPSPLSVAARRRRPSFPDRDAAFTHYAAKPPLNGLDPEALRAYVDHGFRDRPDGSVELKCAPETEAGIFEASVGHGAFERLDEISCPATIVASGDGGPPATVASLVAERLPDGLLEVFADLSHFGPMEDPEAIAKSIARSFVAFS